MLYYDPYQLLFFIAHMFNYKVEILSNHDLEVIRLKSPFFAIIMHKTPGRSKKGSPQIP